LFDEAVELAEFLYGCVHERRALTLIGQIGVLKNCAAACFLNLRSGFFAAVFLNVAEENGSAFGGGHASTFEADALGRTGNDDDFTGQTLCHAPLPRTRELTF